MLSLRRIVPTLALVAALVTSSAAPVVAAARHSACTAESHHCGAVARIAACCCGHDSAQDDSTPVQSRVEVHADHSAVPAVAGDVVAPAMPRPPADVHASPPHFSRRDLPTLFASLLI